MADRTLTEKINAAVQRQFPGYKMAPQADFAAQDAMRPRVAHAVTPSTAALHEKYGRSGTGDEESPWGAGGFASDASRDGTAEETIVLFEPEEGTDRADRAGRKAVVYSEAEDAIIGVQG